MTSFIGRQQEAQHVSALLAACRLITLIGAGGCGNTRLAQRLGGTWPRTLQMARARVPR